jgi:hypothetical protein
MSVVIAVLDDTDRLRPIDLRWPLRIAAQHGGEITFVVPASGDSKKTTNVDLSDEAPNDALTREQTTALGALLDQELTPEGWVISAQEPSIEADAEKHDENDAPVGISLISVPTKEIISTVLPLVAGAGEDLLLTVVEKLPHELTAWREINRKLLQITTCKFACVLPGEREADGEILFKPSRRQYTRMATPLALALATRHDRKATGLWIEPDIGAESERVGRKMLDRGLRSARDCNVCWDPPCAGSFRSSSARSARTSSTASNRAPNGTSILLP